MLPIEIKAIVRYRDGFRCVECGLTNDEHLAKHGRALDVHRLVPGSNYTIDGCQTLCRSCHRTKPKIPRGGPCATYRTIAIRGPVADALRRCARETQRTVAAVAKLALREHFAEFGIVLPPEDKPHP